jgi:SAM-dependent methyltransferase
VNTAASPDDRAFMNPAEFETLARTEQSLWWFRGMERILFALLDPVVARHKLSRVMEAGSGTGYMARVLSARYGWHMFPAELAWEGVSLTPKHPALAPVQADIAACPFPDAAFDAVISLDVLVHFAQGDEAAAFREFTRVVKPGGLLVIRVSALHALRSRHSQFTHEQQRFVRGRLIAQAEASGFRVMRCTYANSLLLPVALFRFRVWEPLMNSPVASGTAPLSSWLNRLLSWPLAVEAWLIARGVNLPLGQSLVLVAVRSN